MNVESPQILGWLLVYKDREQLRIFWDPKPWESRLTREGLMRDNKKFQFSEAEERRYEKNISAQ